MIYNLRWHEKALDDLQGLDRGTQKKIVTRLKDYLSKEPAGLGKPLKGIFRGLYRYRYGSYRIIYAIDEESRTVMILRIADRKKVYDDPL